MARRGDHAIRAAATAAVRRAAVLARIVTTATR
jgi:hypothetical protein